MDNIQNTIDTITNQGILPLYFNTDEIISLAILRALYKSGIKAVEYTNRGPEAVTNFKKMVAIRDLEMPGMLLGIGTIKNIEQAEQYDAIGADFFISPGFVPEVSQFLQSKKKLYCPGCMTPTEIITAENAGIKFIKLFPGNILSPKFMNSIKDIFPSLHFMTTGGVDTTHASINSWFSAGVSAVGMGSKLITKERTDNGDYDGIENETRKVLQIVQIIQKQL
ncbi:MULTISPECIES: bifunctional 4-hydroxy-2-oxoglutarate aldolase/2-dehydro-3-deoxy-phosphogluconate aldolase [unclassified Flavobacterium]|uniref:bifunctional 4-hydroxy-2-oxoglutarate aldolase/2-dehydro-3-deoxy-phosphogluconate aldolase n=1 Tax=unclassified Flavobacterium TaxID=196869 RepID=UPI000F0C7F97|nr:MULTISPECIES: bifunctional 4-hydroxy-2-oxoglutarate aldolase/2-dehydro-3-deoxy-phosphogluconate aldolase [unclassified Flavobacterium]AYN04153.1 bifunctional 4-hydroxy-2-oxoglutarate aldolase/2-dehydro-3-deoxy-phosphogluconate aldolase [Flavobacterium sp. 140616W15]MCD0475505.1 bifunctional 4-hydroxy-2-oxoglutarate aldolase/2-dehydro-3-deoxy-phosphogluconate aldolase [Flavobacterium sp. EDS]